ncbi:MAG: tetratricopeptide repeat protein [Muribaculaceae bacterium]|nr:tetratricopeptide repeat protein [Muribaculaceae bacterium]
MNTIIYRNIALALFIGAFYTISAQSLDLSTDEADTDATETTEQVKVGSEKRSAQMNVRNLIKEGNKLYHDKRYSEAEVCYNKALEINPNSAVAQFNLASTLMLNNGNSDPTAESSPINQAERILQSLVKTAGDETSIVEKSFYNLGNIAFNRQQYAESIELYKNALRKNPDNDKARENLRLAQLKMQNQDQNQNQDQQQDQDQQEQQDQQQQQQNQDQQQDKNQQNQNKNQEQQQNQQQQMSDANAERILKAMENAEAATRRKVEAQKAKEQQSNSRYTTKPW